MNLPETKTILASMKESSSWTMKTLMVLVSRHLYDICCNRYEVEEIEDFTYVFDFRVGAFLVRGTLQTDEGSSEVEELIQMSEVNEFELGPYQYLAPTEKRKENISSSMYQMILDSMGP